jgi:hypothetical protein
MPTQLATAGRTGESVGELFSVECNEKENRGFVVGTDGGVEGHTNVLEGGADRQERRSLRGQ